jgi:hypothetical protein
MIPNEHSNCILSTYRHPGELRFQVTACFLLKHRRKKEKKKPRDETPRSKMQLFFQEGFMFQALKSYVLKCPPRESVTGVVKISHTHLR